MSRSFAVLGLPHAGKSVWLGRVWHAVNQERRQLRKRGAIADLEPLRILGDPLEEGRFPDRTSREAPPSFVAPLRWMGPPAEDLDLHVADYNGEELNAIWRRDTRAWSEDWDKRANADGLVVVVRADRVRRSLSSRVVVPAARGDDRARRLFPDAQPDFDAPSDLGSAPTAVELVELLQMIRHVRGLSPGQIPNGWRLAIVLSAWDAIDPALQELGPRNFLRHELGLLDDLLATNFETRDVRVFGLSAVGGDLGDKRYLRTFEAGEVDDHGWLCWDADGVRTHRDITLPIGWLLLGDRALPQGEPWAR
jgi:hypothetical protein